MSQLNRSGWQRRSALCALLLGALPVTLLAQVRQPPSGTGAGATRSRAAAPKRRTEIFLAGGTLKLNEINATQGTIFTGSVGMRKQLRSPEWLYVGGVLDLGRTSVDGAFFPYEKRVTGDTTRFVEVDGSAGLVAGRVTADALFDIGEEDRFQAGFGVNIGLYAALPSPAGGEGAGTFVAPTFGVGFVGRADLTKRYGLVGSAGFNRLMGFDRAKLRPSDPALADPVFLTPTRPVPDGVKGIGGLRATFGISYRLGVKPVTRRGTK